MNGRKNTVVWKTQLLLSQHRSTRLKTKNKKTRKNPYTLGDFFFSTFFEKETVGAAASVYFVLSLQIMCLSWLANTYLAQPENKQKNTHLNIPYTENIKVKVGEPNKRRESSVRKTTALLITLTGAQLSSKGFFKYVFCLLLNPCLDVLFSSKACVFFFFESLLFA
jgi:hypothetical protein